MLVANILHKMLIAFILIKYVHVYLFNFTNLWINFLGIILMFGIYVVYFKNDFKIVLSEDV